MVNKLRAALDANANLPKTPSKKAASDVTSRKRFEDISVKSTSKQFESFLKSLARCANLLEAKRIRNDIEINLRRARLMGGGSKAFPLADRAEVAVASLRRRTTIRCR